MKDNKESHPIYIAIDSSKIVRCKWCGTAESENWRGPYCSTDCQYADSSHGLIYGFILIGICTPLLLAFGGGDSSFVFMGSFLTVLMTSPLLMCGVNNLKLRQKIPQGSRMNEAYSDSALLKVLPSMVSCPRCNGNIDLPKVSEDMVYVCEYCGTSGTIEILKTN